MFISLLSAPSRASVTSASTPPRAGCPNHYRRQTTNCKEQELNSAASRTGPGVDRFRFSSNTGFGIIVMELPVYSMEANGSDDGFKRAGSEV